MKSAANLALSAITLGVLVACAGGSGGSGDDSTSNPSSGGSSSASSAGGSSASSASSSSSNSSASSSASGGSSSSSSAASSSATVPTSLGADGWASYYASGTGVTNGGTGADSAHTYTVTSRSELIKALYTGAVIAADGSFTYTAIDPTPKIIYVSGSISLNTNAAGTELTESDYACSGWSFEDYKTAYNPKTWNRTLASTGKPASPSGALETARSCSANKQAAVVKLAVGSNTSILGLGSDAKIVHGQLSLPAGTDNVVIRNITFEDAFDFFPLWDPTDSYNVDATYTYAIPPTTADATSTYPKCQYTYDATTDNGPHQCPGGRWNSNYDLLGLSGATHVWIDHCTFTDGDRETSKYPSVWEAPYIGHEYEVEHHDGLVDITLTSNYVTVSYNRVGHHQKAHLIGSSDSVTAANGWGALSVTLHHNYYDEAGERLPRVRMGKVHVYNNYYSGTFTPALSTPPYYGLSNPKDPDRPFIYGLGIGHLSKIYSENNVFEISARAGDAAVTQDALFWVWHKANPTSGLAAGEYTYFYDSGSTLNGAATSLLSAANAKAATFGKPTLLSTDTYWKPSSVYTYTADSAASVKATVTAKAGAGKL